MTDKIGPLEMSAEEVPRFYAGIINKMGDEMDALRAENAKNEKLLRESAAIFKEGLADLRAVNATLEAENEQLKETIGEWQEIHGTFTGDVHRACQAEIERLRAALADMRESSGAILNEYWQERLDEELARTKRA